MTDDEIIAVVQAHKEGKKLQHRLKNPINDYQDFYWHDIGQSGWTWNFLERDYRVAPEPRKPREWNICLVGESIVGQSTFTGNQPVEQVRVREVIE